MNTLNPENRPYKELAEHHYRLLRSLGWDHQRSEKSTAEMLLDVKRRDDEEAKKRKSTVFKNLAPVMETVVDLLREAGIEKGMRIEIAPPGGMFTISRGPEAKAAREANPPKPLPTRPWRASLIDPDNKKTRTPAVKKFHDMGFKIHNPDEVK